MISFHGHRAFQEPFETCRVSVCQHLICPQTFHVRQESSLSSLLVQVLADFNRHKCIFFRSWYGLQLYWTEVLELARFGRRQASGCGTRRLVSAWFAQWAPMMHGNPFRCHFNDLGWAALAPCGESTSLCHCAQVIDFPPPTSAELLSFGRPIGVAPMGCACSKASQASQPGQDAKELCAVHRSLVMPSLDSLILLLICVLII